MNNYEKRANILIADLKSAIKLEEETIRATSSDDRKVGCKMRIDTAKWGISVCKYILTGRQEAE